jgi:hypothetical protein
MSLVEELGAQVRAATDELPVAGVTTGLARLRAGLDLLRWARQESTHEFGTDRLAVAAEHLENAARALLAAQEQLASYLTTIGLAQDGSPPPPGGAGPAAASKREPVAGAGDGPEGTDAQPLTDWWSVRVGVLTGTQGQQHDRSGPTEPDELLARVADRVRAGDRDGLAGQLGAAKAHVGLALAALAPSRAYDAATHLLGRPPVAADLDRLTALARPRVTALLPGLPVAAIDAQLARVCRAPAAPLAAPLHPADSAVAAAVLVGVLGQQTGAARGTQVEQESRGRS